MLCWSVCISGLKPSDEDAHALHEYLVATVGPLERWPLVVIMGTEAHAILWWFTHREAQTTGLGGRGREEAAERLVNVLLWRVYAAPATDDTTGKNDWQLRKGPHEHSQALRA